MGGKFLDVLEPIELGGKITTGLPDFGPDITTEGITGEVVIVDDGTFEGSKGCGPSEAGSLTGKIAMIDRGLCIDVGSTLDAAMPVVVEDQIFLYQSPPSKTRF